MSETLTSWTISMGILMVLALSVPCADLLMRTLRRRRDDDRE